MITKKTYARYLINEFKKQNGISLNTPNKELNQYVMQSTSLGIGLEYFGDLDEEYKEYIAGRSGNSVINCAQLEIELFPQEISVLAKRNDDFTKFYSEHILTVREFMDLLPD